MIDIWNQFKAQIVAGLLATALLVTGGALVVAKIENRSLSKQAANLDLRINDPTTGYATRLAQATTSTAQLETALSVQRQRFEAKAREDATILAATRERLAAAQSATRDARADATRILASPATGDTLEARLRDVDTRILETLE